MSTADDAGHNELVVAEDGSIPADQLARLGLRPGAHLRVIESTSSEASGSVAGSLVNFPDLDWDDFERGSELARNDLSA